MEYWDYFLKFLVSNLTAVVGLLGIFTAIKTILSNKKNSRDKNSIDFEQGYKRNTDLNDAWLVFLKVMRESSSYDISNLAYQYGSIETQSLVKILNEWERAANGIFHDIYDGNYLYKVYGTTVIGLYEYSYPFIEERQKGNPRSFIQLTRLYIKWKIKRGKEDRVSFDKELSDINSRLDKLF